MAQITDYDTLVAATSDWDERDRSSDIDELIGLAEAEFRLHFGPNYAKETTVTLTFTSGVATLPTGYIRSVSLSHATGGPLNQVSWAALARYNPLAVSGIPALYAISGMSIKTAPLLDGDLSFTYEGTLTGLSSGNTTNWLIANAPQAYLSMVLHFAKAKYEDPSAGTYKATALATLDGLAMQDAVGRHGNATVSIPGRTP